MSTIPQIHVSDLDDHLRQGTPLIDVRELDEYLGGHVPGAIHIPLSELGARWQEVPAGGVNVICKSGGRSQRACEFLLSEGRAVGNVAGGTDQWVASGRPVVTGPQPVEESS